MPHVTLRLSRMESWVASACPPNKNPSYAGACARAYDMHECTYYVRVSGFVESVYMTVRMFVRARVCIFAKACSCVRI